MDEKEVEKKLNALDKAITELKKRSEHFINSTTDSISSTLVSITDASARIYKLEMEVKKINQKLK